MALISLEGPPPTDQEWSVGSGVPLKFRPRPSVHAHAAVEVCLQLCHNHTWLSALLIWPWLADWLPDLVLLVTVDLSHHHWTATLNVIGPDPGLLTSIPGLTLDLPHHHDFAWWSGLEPDYSLWLFPACLALLVWQSPCPACLQMMLRCHLHSCYGAAHTRWHESLF